MFKFSLFGPGYYDGVIFHRYALPSDFPKSNRIFNCHFGLHRIVPGFLVQTGDRTGTGNGGESFYGGSYHSYSCFPCSLTLLAPEPFEDEIHPRLRYAHRGLVGMANNGQKNSNDSQFFITLGTLGSSSHYIARMSLK